MTTPDVLRAVIYIRAAGEIQRWAGLCLTHCVRLGYEVAAVVQDVDGTRWRDVDVMLAEHRAEVVVTGGLEQLPPDRVPRIEVAEDLPGPPVRRRPTIMR